jgi:hypothetical protein
MLLNSKILMNRNIKTGILLLFCSILFSRAFPAVIEGYEPDYAGRVLVFYTYSDPILKNQDEAFRITIDGKGNFRQEVKLNSTLFCLSDFDVYKVMLIVTPESSLKIKLPALRKKTLPESKNPYFKPITLWLPVASGGENEVNHLVSALELRYNQLTTRYFNQLYFQHSDACLDSVKTQIEGEFDKYDSPLLKKQTTLKIKLLESDIYPTRQQKIFKGVSLKDYNLSNPVFIDLFDQVFNNKLTYEANSVKSEDLKKAIAICNLAYVKKYFAEKYCLDNKLIDYVLLKIIHDAYFTNLFPQKTIVSMLDDSLLKTNEDIKIREIASGVKQKLLFLSTASIAPAICLNDLSGQRQCSDKLKKTTYLLFVDMEMKVCREHLKYLSTIESKFKNQLAIFIVIKNSDFATINKFFSENQIPGIKVLDGKGDSVAAEYKIRSYPSAFLLDENHKVVLSPAKNPLDGFEVEYAAILKGKQMERFRNQR